MIALPAQTPQPAIPYEPSTGSQNWPAPVLMGAVASGLVLLLGSFVGLLCFRKRKSESSVAAAPKPQSQEFSAPQTQFFNGPATVFGADVTIVTRQTPESHPIAIPGHLKVSPGTDYKIVKDRKVAKGGMSEILEVKVYPAKLLEMKSRSDITSTKELILKRIRGIRDPELIELFHFEVAVTDAVRKFTKHSVELLGWSENPYGMILRRYEGSLDAIVLQRAKIFPMKILNAALSQICEALSVCERLGVAHNDMKPANVLVTTKNGKLTCYLNDYGCAMLIKDSSKLRYQLKKGMSGITLHYASPEMLATRTQQQNSNSTSYVGNKADIYAFAISAFEVLFQKRAWGQDTNERIISLVLQGERPQSDTIMERTRRKEDEKTFEALMTKVIVPAWSRFPRDRPTFAQLNEVFETIQGYL